MMLTADRSLPTPEAEVQQFMVGFVSVMEAAASGDLGPRDEYLESVLPAIQAAGISLAITVCAMPRLSTAVGCVLGREHVAWVADFIGSYTEKLLSVWGAR